MSPELILINSTLAKTLWIVTTAFIGMIGISSGLMGYWFRPMYWLERIIVIPAGLMLIIPGTLTDAVGLGLLAIIFVYQIVTRSKNQKFSSEIANY